MVLKDGTNSESFKYLLKSKGFEEIQKRKIFLDL